jgi:hypothetical protein
MGGPGSGSPYHWWRDEKKTTTEDCLSIDSVRWTREGILKAGIRHSGTWTWTYRSGSAFSVHYDADLTLEAVPWLRLWYAFTRTGSSQVHQADYCLRLTATRPRFGGLRWWFVCPLVVNGHGCGRRVGKLFLPPPGLYFGCRHCYQLTYTGCQESRKYDGLWRQMAGSLGWDVATVRRTMNRIGKRRG